MGCRFATAFHALTAQAQLKPEEWLAVFGCGGVGLSAVMIAVALGARVVAVDPSPAALGRAADLGAEATVAGTDPVSAVPLPRAVRITQSTRLDPQRPLLALSAAFAPEDVTFRLV